MKTRIFLTIALSFAYGLWMMIIGGNGMTYNGQAAMFFWIISSFLAATAYWAVWNLELRIRERDVKPAKAVSAEKKKREHIDSVLRDLSDEDLLRLRRRLLDGTINDSHLEDALVGEDGELMHDRR